MTCGSATWLNDGSATCVSARDVVGPKNVSLLAANQTVPVIFFAHDEQFVAVCAPEFYGVIGQLCAPCPLGATCPGGELNKSLVLAQPGFWVASPATLTAANCPVERQGDNLPFCVYAVACAPADSCLGSNICAAGYKGDRCVFCNDGFYRTNGSCAPCPASPYAIIVIFIIGGESPPSLPAM